jgi:predicted PurR-regulated permease PerM
MASILPAVIYLRKKKMPKITAVVIPYTIMIVSIILLVFPLINFVIGQIRSLIIGFPVYLKQASLTLNLPLDASQLQSYLTTEINNISKNAFTFTTQVFGGLFSFMMIFIISFYLLLYYDEFKNLISKLFTRDKRPYVLSTLDQVNAKLGAWLRGQLVLSIFIWLISWITLTLLGIPNALPLALLSGILEIVPTLGPILSAIPAVIVALTISPTLAVYVIIAYIIIQFFENNLLVPKVMEKAVGLNPIVVILGVLVGANLIGISGALLAIPLITFTIVIIKSFGKNGSDL